MRPGRSADGRSAAFLVLLIVILYADILFFGRGLYAAGVADLLGYHIPMNWVLRDVVSRGAFPYWNPYFSAGQPLAANPAYEVFYPLQWLVFLPSFHFGFQLHIIIHFVIAALGMYLLLRGLSASPIAATFGASVFVVSGPYLSVATKLPMLFALSWMPLALECARRELEGHSWRRFSVAALVLGVQLLVTEPMIVIQTWAFIAGYAIWRRRWRRDAIAIGALALAAFLAAAVQLLPAMDFARDSVRSESFTFADVSDWSMPGQRLIEFALPSVFRPAAITTMYRGRTEAFVMEMYVGIFVVLLAAAGILIGARGTWAALIAMGASAILAMGDHTPLLKLLYALHLIRSIRYPEKFIVSGTFALIVFAALLFDRLIARDKRLLRSLTTIAAIWLGIVLIAFFAGDQAYFGPQLVRAAVAFAFALLLRNTRIALGAAILVASILDGWIATKYLVPRMPGEFFDPPPIARTIPAGARIYPEAFWQFLDSDPNVLAWIRNIPDATYWWMLRNSMVDHLPVRYGFGIVLEGDTDRTSLKTTDAFREAMRDLVLGHVMAGEEPFLKMSGAGAKLTYRPPDQPATNQTTPVDAVMRDYPRFAFADRIVRTRSLQEIVANLDQQRGLANVAFADIEPFTPARGEVVRANESPNAIALDVRSGGNALLVISVSAHRYWSATLDGASAELLPVDFAYQGIRVPAGTHHIDMRYRNPWILPSGVVSLLALIALGAGMTRRASARA